MVATAVDEASLLKAIQAGDEEAASTLCQRFRPRILAVVRGRRVPLQDCEVVVQGVLAAAVQQIRLGRFRAESSLGTWLFTIARGKAVDYWRSSTALPATVPLDTIAATSAEPQVHYSLEERLAVQEALRQLEVEDRFVLWLYDAEGRTLEEIGRLIGRKKSTVLERLKRARERFRAVLSGGTGQSTPKQRLLKR